MKHLKRILLFIFLSQLIASCSFIGLNISHKTPRRAGKYPRFTARDTLRGTIGKYRKNYDVTFYDINIDVDIKNEYLKGFVDIYFTALSNLDTIQLDLYKNMKVDNIIRVSNIRYQDTSRLKYYRKYDAVFVIFDKRIEKAQNEMLRFYYEGSPIKAKKPPWEGGFVWKEDKDKNPWIGVSCELDGASLWWPLKDVLYDETDSLKMNVTIPEGLFCISNGMLIDRKKNNNKETFTWKTNYPINTYDATIYIGNFQHFNIPYVKPDKTMDLDFYVLPQHLEIAKTHFIQAVDILHFYESVFGEYPWIKEDYKLIESPYEGMEHQTAIAYGNGYKNGPISNYVDYIILHETAHEWWGNSVTAKDYADIWLHEGFATYSEALYVEHTHGYMEYLNYLRMYSMLIKNKRPVVGPRGVDYWDYKDPDVYMKGCLMLHTLRNTIDNDSLFFKIIKSFYSQYKYSIAETKDFINVVNNMTGMDYKWFFNQYLYSRVCPKLEWNCVNNDKDNSYELYYKWSNVGNEFKLPVKIFADGQIMTIYPTDKPQFIKLKSDNKLSINIRESYIVVKKNKRLF